ncbi:MAG: L-seryl-tRNA(Sec) selenium transferase [Terriglobales bacterium]
MVPSPDRHSLLRQLPSVDSLLRRPELAPLWEKLGPAGARQVISACLAALRQAPTATHLATLDDELRAAADRRLAPSLRPVINATGVILHTNLGRAPLARAAVERVAAIAGNYSNLELDLSTGRRARRDRHVLAWLQELTGAAGHCIVNTNAAAVLLAVHTLALETRGEVLLSRGELVEIGEGFRIADIIARAGARLVEVGSTNRTRLEDYEKAITRRTRLILRVHRSNFSLHGFVEQPPLAALAALAQRHKLPLVEDLGSGVLAPLPGAESEPRVADSLRAGATLVTYSGDKLLGGPQAGLISGEAAVVEKLRSNSLYRALRADRLAYAALEATLALYARQAWGDIPIFAAAAAPDLEARTRAFAASLPRTLQASVEAGTALVGGGSLPGHSLPTWRIGLPEAMAEPLRRGSPPVITRLEAGRCWCDLRTVLPAQLPALQAAITAAYAALSSPTSRPPATTGKRRRQAARKRS